MSTNERPISSSEAWSDVGEHLRTLGSLLRQRADGPSADPAADATDVAPTTPTDDEVKEAVRVIADRASATLGALTESVRDPDVRAEAELATSAFVTAVGATVAEFGEQLMDLAVRPAEEADQLGNGSWEPDDQDLEG